MVLNDPRWSMQWSVFLTPELAMIPDSSIFVRQSSLTQETEIADKECSAVLSCHDTTTEHSLLDFVDMIKKDAL